MNSFANSLFSLLFGWARTLIRQVWASASSGQYNGFFVWLGDHWIWLVLILCLGCTVLDFVIWLVRWRPYLVWRTMFRRVVRFFRGDRRRFEEGYQGGVTLDISHEPEKTPENPWNQEPLTEDTAWQTAGTAHTFTRAVLQVEDRQTQGVGGAGFFPEPAYDPGPASAYANADETQEPRQRQFIPPAYELPPIYASSRQMTTYTSDMPAARRKRRSEKYERRRPEWREKLIKGDEEEDALLDGLPPVVDRQEAFHEPVYPQRTGENVPYAAWRRPTAGENKTDGNRV